MTKAEEMNDDNIGNHIETQELIEKNSDKLDNLSDESKKNIEELISKISAIPTTHPQLPKMIEYKKELSSILEKIGNEDVVKAVKSLETSIASIKPAEVTDTQMDTQPIIDELKAILAKIEPLELPFKFGQNGRLLVSDVGGGGTRAVSVVDSGGDDVNIAQEAKQDDLITELKLKADLTETQPVSADSLPLPSGASTSAKQLADNHNVTVSNPTADPETGLAKEAKQDTQIANQDFLTNYNISDKETDVATEYFGFVDKDENWYIQRMTATDIRYVAGAGDYATAWTGRAGLSYDYFFNTF